jgi:hypothetical protein
MSLIAKALKKAAESRQTPQEQKVESIVYLADKPQPWPKAALFVILPIIALALLAVSASVAAIMAGVRNSQSSRSEIISLERTVKAQEKRINDLAAAVHKDQKVTDTRIRNLKSRVNNEADEIKAGVKVLSSTEAVHYASLKQAIVDDRQQMLSLDQYTRSLDKKIEILKTATPEAQANNPNLVSGN